MRLKAKKIQVGWKGGGHSPKTSPPTDPSKSPRNTTMPPIRRFSTKLATKFFFRFQVLIVFSFFSAAEFVSLPEWQFHGYTEAKKGEVGQGCASVQHQNIPSKTIFPYQVLNNGHSLKFTLEGSPPQVSISITILAAHSHIIIDWGWYWYCEDLRRSLERVLRRRIWRGGEFWGGEKGGEGDGIGRLKLE